MLEISVGTAFPFGTSEFQDGVNFAFFSRHATNLRLELFDHAQDAVPSHVFDFDPQINRTGDIWHLWIKGIKHGQLYGYRVDGPYDPKNGLRYNVNKLLLDPYSKALTSIENWDFTKAFGYPPYDKINNAGLMPKCIFISNQFDWQGDHPLKHPWSKTIIYETHVRGLTISADVSHPGTYRGLIDKIPYLKSLGITAVELMPIQEFNQHEPEGTNYWGYNPVLFSAVKASYSATGGLGQQINEFKEMVLALHQAGIEVILDLVFNHTAENDEKGPTLSYRGIDNVIFYLLDTSKDLYLDFTGTGNTINANHPIVQDDIINALRYWVMEMHIDGFRFDEAAIFDRDEVGEVLINAPLVNRITVDPILSGVKIIAEPWDATGISDVKTFGIQPRWASWNNYYRDEIREFWRGDPGKLGAFAARICGSADIFYDANKLPKNSINYITCHDGLTLNDLVTYQGHNGSYTSSFSANYGIEGPSNDPLINETRKRQIKNFILTLFISRGVPMLYGGDEFCRTQQGNPNAYCEDNAISWYDWSLLDTNQNIFTFTQEMIAFRASHPILAHEYFYTDQEVQWYDSKGCTPEWSNQVDKHIACLIHENTNNVLFLMFNAEENDIEFVLPVLDLKLSWHLAVDTSVTSPEKLLLQSQTAYLLKARSSAILMGKAT